MRVAPLLVTALVMHSFAHHPHADFFQRLPRIARWPVARGIARHPQQLWRHGKDWRILLRLSLRGGSDDDTEPTDILTPGWGEDEEMEKVLMGLVRPEKGSRFSKLVADLMATLSRSGVQTRDKDAVEDVVMARMEQLHNEDIAKLPTEDVFEARDRAIFGRGMTSDWVCLRCAAANRPYNSECENCGIVREAAEKEITPETITVRVPADTRCISTAVNATQYGLSLMGWNQRYRTGVIRVSKGATPWPWEMPVAQNLSLRICGEGGGSPEVNARWWMQEGCDGNASHVTFQYEHPHRSAYPVGVPHPSMLDFETEEEEDLFWAGGHPDYDLDRELDLTWSVIDIWGGPWQFDQCSVRGGDVIAISTAAEANVTTRDCYLGGINGKGSRAICGLDLAGTSRCAASQCDIVNTVCGGVGVRAMCNSVCVLRGCNISYNDFGTSVDHDGDIDAENCTFDENTWGTWYVGFVAKDTRMRLVNCTVPSGPGWYDERRPGKLEERNVYVNDTALVELRDWQEYAKMRHAQGHRDGWLERNVISERGGEAWRLG